LTIIWRSPEVVNINKLPEHLRACLLETGSLTHLIRNFCRDHFELKLKSQSRKKPLLDETQALKLRHGSYALVRESYLMCNSNPWVYARSIMPPNNLTGLERRFTTLGNEPLATMLFSTKNTSRAIFEIAKIHPRERLYQLAMQTFKFKESILWGRRSIFYIKDKPLLVIEILLPAISKCTIIGQ